MAIFEPNADNPHAGRSAPLAFLILGVFVLATLVGWGFVVAIHHAQAHHVFTTYAGGAGDVCNYLNATECATQCSCGVCGDAVCAAALYYKPSVRPLACNDTALAWVGPRAVCGTRDHGAALLTSAIVVLVTGVLACFVGVIVVCMCGCVVEPLRKFFAKRAGYTAMA